MRIQTAILGVLLAAQLVGGTAWGQDPSVVGPPAPPANRPGNYTIDGSYYALAPDGQSYIWITRNDPLWGKVRPAGEVTAGSGLGPVPQGSAPGNPVSLGSGNSQYLYNRVPTAVEVSGGRGSGTITSAATSASTQGQERLMAAENRATGAGNRVGSLEKRNNMAQDSVDSAAAEGGAMPLDPTLNMERGENENFQREQTRDRFDRAVANKEKTQADLDAAKVEQAKANEDLIKTRGEVGSDEGLRRDMDWSADRQATWRINLAK
jgi:hypothetical protein